MRRRMVEAGSNVTFRCVQKPKDKQKPHPEFDYPPPIFLCLSTKTLV
jgi:hypothetical protein